MNKYIKILIALFLTAGVLALASCSNGSQAQSQSLNLDKPAPDFILKDLSGKPVALSSFQGKPVFFNYWATWCPACIEEMPIIQSIYEDPAYRNITLLTVNNGEDQTTVKDFLQTNHYSFPVLLDSQGDVAQKYNIQFIPVSVFVDKDGKLQSRVIGAFANKAALEKQLAGLFQ